MSKSYLLPFNRGQIIITSKVLSHFFKYSQNRFYKYEAGGQLFSKNPEQRTLIVSLATGPYISDKRSRYSFNLDIKKANSDRKKLFKKDIHPVGLWHTHPEKLPDPSFQDRNVTIQYLNSFNGEMDGFLSVIIGNEGQSSNIAIWVAWNDAPEKWIKLKESVE